MSATAMRILVIGKRSPSTSGTLKRLAVRGWGSHCVATLQEARELLEAFQFDVVLALETLSDGRGYDVSEAVMRHSGTLLVGVALSESLLWLAVVERGARVLGKRALNASTLETELEKLLATLSNENAGEIIRNPRPGANRPSLQRAALPERRKSADVRPA
jgi:hypothetical protein